MDRHTVKLHNLDIDVYSMNTVVVGSGAAGLNAADSLYALGQRDMAIVTEGMKMGTSRNTGSDKQTYYKLTLSGDAPDSVAEMARTLFGGGCMHGDIALVEAALSARSFYKLANIGVPFPHNKYGEYIGYKTDHDPRQRATSAGPLTSKYMTERLEEQVRNKGITVLDGFRVIGILTDRAESDANAIGLIALDMDKLGSPNMGFTLFNCTNIIYATGGPAGMYSTSVYPESQTGATGIAFEAGVKGINLTESQYGIASLKFRWNLSGTYQQVLPRYISTERDGSDEREFLPEHFKEPGRMLDAIFLKGYQWPFDPRKIGNFGSSLIDILVYIETQIKGRKVYLDFTRNPGHGNAGEDLDFSLLSRESHDYLKNSGALFGTPFERLKKMNRPAIDLYRNNGIDLEREYLEIAVCAQHNNGGLLGNIWWESNIRHFFPVGEVNGTFGVYRPGGSALNSTQVGSLRAAQYIHANYRGRHLDNDEFMRLAGGQVTTKVELAKRFMANLSCSSNVMDMRKAMQQRMSGIGAHIRTLEGVLQGMEECSLELASLGGNIRISSPYELPQAFINRDILITQYVYLSAIKEYITKGGKSRGSYLIRDQAGENSLEGLKEGFRYSIDEGNLSDRVCEMEFRMRGDEISCTAGWKPVRPVPADDNWFENVWNEYMNGEIFK